MEQDQVRGALLGLAWGDALGCPIEGWRSEEIRRHYGQYRTLPEVYPASVAELPARRRRRLRPLGLHSDDTQQALALLVVVLGPQGWSARRWAELLVAGADAGAWRGTGGNFQTALAALRRGVAPQRSGSASAGIGAAMRAGLVGAALREHPDTLARVVMEASLVTHADLRAAATAYAVAEAVRLLTCGAPAAHVLAALPDRVGPVESVWAAPPGDWVVQQDGLRTVSDALSGFADDPPRDLDALGERVSAVARPHLALGRTRAHPNQGFALLAGLHGLIAGLLARDPGEQLAAVIRQGYDTDTVGAICGTVLGARFGTSWIPTHRLLDAARLQRWADALVAGGSPPDDWTTFLEHEAALTRREQAFQHDDIQTVADQS